MSTEKTFTAPFTLTLDELQRLFIEAHIKGGGHKDLKTLAACLGISRHALRRRIMRFRIDTSAMIISG